jgi:D-amino peptidase
MKVYISADIEGINGVMGDVHTISSGEAYGHARTWMAEEVNSAIRGAAAAGAQEFIVKDSHGPATNILAHELDPRAQLISGWGSTHSMVEGVDESFDAVFLVGYHAKVGTERGVLSHTITGLVKELRLNGEPVGETALSAQFAGHYGVPVALVAGDDAVAAEAEALLPGVTAVAVKQAMNRRSAKMLPLAEGRKLIEESARTALEHLGSVKPYSPDRPTRMELELPTAAAAEICSHVPGVERIGAMGVGCQVEDAMEFTRIFEVLLCLAGSRR